MFRHPPRNNLVSRIAAADRDPRRDASSREYLLSFRDHGHAFSSPIRLEGVTDDEEGEGKSRRLRELNREEFAEQFGSEGIDVVRIISFVLRAFLRVLNEAVARLLSGVSGIRAWRIDGASMQTMRAEFSISDDDTRRTRPRPVLIK